MEIRRARPDDALAVARVHVRSWQSAYRGLMPDDFLDALRPEDRAGRYTFGELDAGGPLTFVAWADGEVAGFATVGAADEDDAPGAGALCALYVDPPRWGSGVGRRLTATARAQLVGWGHGHALLWVLAGNERAARFYAADGWSADGTRREAEVWGLTVDEVRYRRPLP